MVGILDLVIDRAMEKSRLLCARLTRSSKFFREKIGLKS